MKTKNADEVIVILLETKDKEKEENQQRILQRCPRMIQAFPH